MKNIFFNKVPFLIAEISANHCGNFIKAKKLIMTAKKNGADAVKLQTYTPESMTLNSNKKYFKIKKGIWKNYKLWDLYKEAQTPYIWHKKLFKYAKEIGIKIFSTPFDENAVDFLETLNCSIYKVASFEMNHINLIKKIASTKKPIIISTGTSTLNEIDKAFFTAKKYGSRDITLLYCVSNYPSKIEDFNIKNIKILKDKYKCRVGLSDHSNDNKVAITSIALGAEVIEKHIALDNQKKGHDIKFSLKGKEIQKFKNDLDITYQLVKRDFFFRNSSEKKNRIFRRSIFITQNIEKGEKFTSSNIKIVRPGNGVDPSYYNQLINKKAQKKLFNGEPVLPNILKRLRIK